MTRSRFSASILSLAAGLALAPVALAQMTQPGSAPAAPAAQPVAQPAATPTGHGSPAVQPAAQPIQAQTPTLTFESMSQDWGKIWDDQLATHKFKFKNTSDRTVTIKQVTTTCGCTAPALEKRTYAPGESGEITVNFNPQGRMGAQTKPVTVIMEDGSGPNIQLNLTSFVKPRVWVEPNRVFFPEQRQGVPGRQVLTVTGRRPDFQVTGLEGLVEPYSARIIGNEKSTDDGDQIVRYTIEVTLDPKTPIGTPQGALRVKTNDPSKPEVQVFASANVVGELRTNPPMLFVRENQPNKVFDAEVRLEGRTAMKFNISSIEVEGPAEMSLVADFEPVDLDGKPGYTIRLSGVTPSVIGQTRGNVVVKTDLPNNEELKIPFYANVLGRAAPAAAVQLVNPPANQPPVQPTAPRDPR